MRFIKKLGFINVLMLALCALIIGVAEYLFLNGHELHGIFIGLWAPTLLGIVVFIKQIKNER